MCTLFADGACQPNPGTGGWAYVLKCSDGNEISCFGVEENTTNNRMELRSVIEGVYRFKHECSIHSKLTLILDSKYVLDGISTWSKNWVKQGWVKKDGKPVLNDDLWKELIFLTDGLNIEFKHVKGHSGHHENERCDKMATTAVKNFKKE